MTRTVINRDGPWLRVEVYPDGGPTVVITYDRKNATDLVTALNCVLGGMKDEPWTVDEPKGDS